MRLSLNYVLLLPIIVYTSSCLGQGIRNGTSPETVFVGSTPGDGLIKSLLNIPPETKIDFIRWHLTLDSMKSNQNIFLLTIVFGESQANTLGFKGGGENRSYKGEYLVSQNKTENIREDIYHLKSIQLPTPVSLVRLNDNLLHLLTPQNKLMVGNGGWSYTLNREEAINDPLALPVLATTLPDDPSRQVIFEGRTPCLELAKENNWNVAPDCFKLKWKLVLNRDSQSLVPTTYSMRRVINNEVNDISGKWTIIRGTASNPSAIIYQLDPDKPEKTLSLLSGDENVLFFLRRNMQLYVGDSDFSFTLNKRVKD